MVYISCLIMAKTKVKFKVPETDYTLLLLDNKCQSNKMSKMLNWISVKIQNILGPP